MSAIDLLQQQHQEVEGFFQRAEASNGEDRIELLGKIAEALTLHAALEEQFFYPFLQKHGLQDDVQKSLEEHAEVKQLISQLLKTKKRDPRLKPLMDKLIQSVRAHVGMEEGIVFPRIQAAVAPALLDQVGEEMSGSIQQLEQQELLEIAENQQQPVFP